jgi:hypothetical protein
MCNGVTEENWPDVVRRVHGAMAEFIRPYLASISKTNDHVSGKAHGSGVYLDTKLGPSLVTCEHVVRLGYQNGYRIAHLPKAGENYYAFNKEWFTEAYPWDLALTQIDTAIWAQGDRRALPVDRIAPSHDIAQHELLMLCGYPEKASYFTMFTDDPLLDSRLIPYTAREAPLPAGYDPEFHFALQYEMDLAEPVDGSKSTLPMPPGFSGAPIWNSGFVASGCSEDWTPEQARIAGIAIEWVETSSCIVASKAEKLTAFLSDLQTTLPAQTSSSQG